LEIQLSETVAAHSVATLQKPKFAKSSKREYINFLAEST